MWTLQHVGVCWCVAMVRITHASYDLVFRVVGVRVVAVTPLVPEVPGWEGGKVAALGLKVREARSYWE